MVRSVTLRCCPTIRPGHRRPSALDDLLRLPDDLPPMRQARPDLEIREPTGDRAPDSEVGCDVDVGEVAARMPPPIQDAPKRRNPSTAAGEVRARAARANRLLIPLRAHGSRPRSQSRAGQPEGGSQADIASWSIMEHQTARRTSMSLSPVEPTMALSMFPRAAHQAPARAAPLPGPSSHHPRPPLRNGMAACTEDAIHSRAPLFRAGVEGRLEAAGRLGGARRALDVGREGKMPSPLCSVIYLEVLHGGT